jgi:capsular exopolysaccharide synthesis family protein
MSTQEVPLMNRDQDRTLQLRDYVDIISRRKLQILLVIALCLGLAMAYGLTRPTLYEAQSKVLVEPIPNPVTAVTSNPQAFVPNMDTEKELVTSDAAAGLVAQRLNIQTTPGLLLKHVTAGVIVNTSVLTVGYSDPNPTAAARLADAFGEAYISLRTNGALRQILAASKAAKKQTITLQRQLSRLDDQIARASASQAQVLQSQRTVLADRLTTTEQRASALDQSLASQEGGKIVQRANVPKSPSSPNLPLFALLGLLAGLLLGVGLAFLRASLGDHITDKDEIERIVGAPIIAEVGTGKRWGRRRSPKLATVRAPESVTSEGYRTVGSYLQRLKNEGGSQTFMVTSPSEGEGKSEVAANLGVVLAEAANSVIVVGANLRHPELQGFFGSTEADDLGAMLEDLKHPNTVIADWSERAENQASLVSSNGARRGDLKVIGDGPVRHSPAAILSNGRATGVFDALRSKAQFILVDAPQVLGVADTSILTRLVDGALLVVHGDKSTRREVERAHRALENAGTRIVGCVYVNPSKKMLSSSSKAN